MSLFKNALEEFDLAIKFNPENSDIYRKKGLVLFGMNRHGDAKTNFEKAISINPQDVQAHINLGMVHYTNGKKIEARIDWENAIALKNDDNDGKALNNIGNIYKAENNFDKAIEHYKKAITFEPGNTTFLNNLGDSYRLAGDFQQAESTLLKSLEMIRTACSPNSIWVSFIEQKEIFPKLLNLLIVHCK